MENQSNSHTDDLTIAVDRLDEAMSRIEGLATRLRVRAERAEQEVLAGQSADGDRARLAEALDAEQARSAELEIAIAEAAGSLDQAIGELRDLSQEG